MPLSTQGSSGQKARIRPNRKSLFPISLLMCMDRQNCMAAGGGLGPPNAGGQKGVARHPRLPLHHCLEFIPTEKEPIRVAGQLFEIKMLVEGLRIIVDAVQDNGDERERLAGLIAVS